MIAEPGLAGGPTPYSIATGLGRTGLPSSLSSDVRAAVSHCVNEFDCFVGFTIPHVCVACVASLALYPDMAFAAAPARSIASRSMRTRLLSKRGPLHQKLILLVSLVAFVLQSYIVQTHIHFAPSIDSGIVVSKSLVTDSKAGAPTTQNSDRGRYPPNDDPAHCSICQEFLHAGQYLAPAPAMALLLTVVEVPVTIVRVIPVVIAPVSHDWHGRAPPIA